MQHYSLFLNNFLSVYTKKYTKICMSRLFSVLLQSKHLISTTMTAISVRDFRNNLASFFNMADKGESVFIRRNQRVYTLVPVTDEDIAITPALAAKISKARKEYNDGQTVGFDSAAEAAAWMDSL